MRDIHAPGQHDATPEEALQWAAERIAMHERALAVNLGRTRGLEYAVQCLIATHPKIETMQSLWRKVSPDVVDAEMQTSLHQAEDYRNALHALMAMVQKTIDARIAALDQDPD